MTKGDETALTNAGGRAYGPRRGAEVSSGVEIQQRLAGVAGVLPQVHLVAGSGLELTQMENYCVKGPKPFGYMFEGVAVKARAASGSKAR